MAYAVERGYGHKLIDGNNIMYTSQEAMKAVLAKQGKNVYLPTLTEDAFDEAMKNKWTEMAGEM